jgi:hypothetical protein
MQQLSSEVNPEVPAEYRADYNNPAPYCGSTCGTGFTVGSGFMSGTGVFTFTPVVEIPVGTLEDEMIGLVVSAGYNASIDPDATLVGVSFTANGVPVTNFTLTTSTGVYTSSGFTPFATSAPEPESWVLSAVGILAIATLASTRTLNKLT